MWRSKGRRFHTQLISIFLVNLFEVRRSSVKIFTLRHSWPVILEAKRRESILLAMALVFAAFTACDSSSSSTDPDPIAEVSSSSDDDEVFSSSSVTDKGTSSGGSSVSSEKPSSSTDTKSSSSIGSMFSVSSSVSLGSSSASLMDCLDEGEIVRIRDRQTGEDVMYICQDGYYVSYIRSSSSATSSSSYFNMDSLYNSKISYGEFVDSRDGQKYRTLHITTSWLALPEFDAFAQNLNYGVQIKLDVTEFDDGKVEKYCYDDDPWYCDNGFGGLYSWSEAMGLPKACDSVWTGTPPACPDSIFPGREYEWQWDDLIIQGVCPDGWHVMNGTEWQALIKGLDGSESGTQLISAVSRGRNGTGFSAVYGGMTKLPTQYERMGELGVYHLPFEYEAGRNRSVGMTRSIGITYKDHHPKNEGLSVRCVKDY
ncbi:hypothetical protein B7989_11735 [Fibrobacter sp. UWB5]|nr:hypothetical protein B7989_11735 [Fibrobacter sp. UWB5]